MGRDTFGNYRTVTKWPVVPPRTAPPYLPPPGTAKAYELEEKRLKDAKGLALKLNGNISPGIARPKTSAASSTRTQPDVLRALAARRVTTPDGEKRAKTPDDARKPPTPERFGSMRRLSTAGSAVTS